MTGLSPTGGLGEAPPPPVFGQTVNPISTWGADYTHHSTTSPPGISDLATGLMCAKLQEGVCINNHLVFFWLSSALAFQKFHHSHYSGSELNG